MLKFIINIILKMHDSQSMRHKIGIMVIICINMIMHRLFMIDITTESDLSGVHYLRSPQKNICPWLHGKIHISLNFMSDKCPK
jgi:hypothetical protein